jgi:ribonuclease BN (tRNA processing enzyme)
MKSALAKAPMLNTQAPAFYRFKIGDFEATIATDGQLNIGDPHKNYLGLSTAETDKQLTDNFQPLDSSILEQNALVVNTGDKLILFDTGLGTLHLFGPTTGRLLNSLKQAGIDPKDIDAVVMTHAHAATTPTTERAISPMRSSTSRKRISTSGRTRANRRK